MALFESLFDLVYLACVIGLGIKLLLQKERSAKLFGAMAVLLGAGDAFHLIPRVISHWAEHSLLENAFVYLIMGLLGGVFFREFTKVFAYSDNTFLGKIHVHVLVLGFFSMLILFLLASNLQKKHTDIAALLRRPILFWHSGVVLTTALLWLHGIIEVTGGYYGKIPAFAISGTLFS